MNQVACGFRIGYAASVQYALPQEGPLCPVHPQVAARGVCVRCGNFVCDVCTDNGQQQACAECRARGGFGFRFTRDDWTTSGLAGHAWTAFKREWGTMLLATVLIGVVFALIGGISGGTQAVVLGVQGSQTPFAWKPMLLSSVLGFVLNLGAAPMLVGYTQLGLRALRGSPMGLGTLFEPYARFTTIATLVSIFSAVGLAFRLVLSVFYGDQTVQEIYGSSWLWLGSLIAAPFFVYVGLGFAFVYSVLADDPMASAFEAMARSWRIAEGKRGAIFWISTVCGVAMVLGVMMCLVPSLVVFPWVSLLWSAAYLALATTPTPARA